MTIEIPRIWVRAKRAIPESPLASGDASAKRGEIGYVEDEADGRLFVDFGRGAILVDPDEVTDFQPTREQVLEFHRRSDE